MLAACHPQVRATGYFAHVVLENGDFSPVVSSPAQFDEEASRPGRAAEHGAHTDTGLLELGVPCDELSRLKDAGAIR